MHVEILKQIQICSELKGLGEQVKIAVSNNSATFDGNIFPPFHFTSFSIQPDRRCKSGSRESSIFNWILLNLTGSHWDIVQAARKPNFQIRISEQKQDDVLQRVTQYHSGQSSKNSQCNRSFGAARHSSSTVVMLVHLIFCFSDRVFSQLEEMGTLNFYLAPMIEEQSRLFSCDKNCYM